MRRIPHVCGCFLLFLTCLSTGDAAAQTGQQAWTGDAFIDALALRLDLDWSPCPEKLGRLQEQATGDIRCGVVGRGDPRREAQRLAMMQASVGTKVLDLDFHDGLPEHLYAGMAGLRPIEPVGGYERQVYLIDRQRVSMWIQTTPEPPIEGGEPEHWIATRVDEIDGEFPDYMPAAPIQQNRFVGTWSSTIVIPADSRTDDAPDQD